MSVSPNRTTLVGKRVGTYRLIRQIGQGGSARVYLATHSRLGTHAAIKVLRTPCSDAALKQIWNEARLLPRLIHPHIVRILDFGRIDPLTYLVMEYALHGTLRHRYPMGSQLPLPTIVSYVRQTAFALQHVHDHGFIHRDVKPENLLLTQNNMLLLSDFGIATTIRYAKFERSKFGTAPYIAPEQLRGEPHFASDQYSLACMVYEWISGRPPFSGSTDEIVQQHLHALPPELSRLVKMLPRAVEQVVMKGLGKEPSERFASVEEFALVLEWASTQPVVRYTTPARRYRSSAYTQKQTDKAGFSLPPSTESCEQHVKQWVDSAVGAVLPTEITTPL